jgi:hypothetical protein
VVVWSSSIAGGPPIPNESRNRQASEVAEFDQLRHLRFCRILPGQRLIQGEQVVGRLGCGDQARIQLLTAEAAAVFAAAFVAGVLDKDATHGLGGGGKEVAAAVPLGCLVPANQAHIGLMHKRRGVEGLPRLLLRELLGR